MVLNPATQTFLTFTISKQGDSEARDGGQPAQIAAYTLRMHVCLRSERSLERAVRRTEPHAFGPCRRPTNQLAPNNAIAGQPITGLLFAAVDCRAQLRVIEDRLMSLNR